MYWAVEGREMPLHWFDSLLASVYFSFVVLCTVGYGDITPKRRTTKILTVAWSFTGMILVTILTTTVYIMLSTAVGGAAGIQDDRAFQGAIVAVEVGSGFEARCRTLGGTCLE